MTDAVVASIREWLFRSHAELCARVRLSSLMKRTHDTRYLDLWTLLLQGVVEAAAEHADVPAPHVCYVSHYPQWGPCLAFERGSCMSALVQRAVDRLQWPELATLPPMQLEGRTLETYVLPDAVVPPRPSPLLSLHEVFTKLKNSQATDICFLFRWRSSGQDCSVNLQPVGGQKRLKFRAADDTVGGLQYCASVAGYDGTKISASVVQNTSYVVWQCASGVLRQQSLVSLRSSPFDEAPKALASPPSPAESEAES